MINERKKWNRDSGWKIKKHLDEKTYDQSC
jgi:hypothetical protein